MGFLGLERRKPKKAGLELNLQRPMSPKKGNAIRKLEARPAGSGRIIKAASPAKSLTPSPKLSAKSDSTFCSVEAWERRASKKSYDSVEAFPASIYQGGVLHCLDGLTNEIHPIFRRSNCHGEVRQRYDIFVPAFRLASRFFQTDCLLPFWYTLLCSPVKEMKGCWYSGSNSIRSWEYTDIPEVLTAPQLEETKHALDQMKDFFRMAVMPNSSEERGCFTYRSRSDGRSRMFMARHYFRGFRNAIKNKDSDLYAWWSFKLARTVLHELAHAVVLSARPLVDRDGNHYFDDNLASEDGFDFERRIFGGIIQSISSDQNRIRRDHAIMFKWPNPNALGLYLTSKHSVGVREKPDPEEVYGADFSLVSFDDILKFFVEGWWTGVVRDDPDAVRFPYEIADYVSLPDDRSAALLGMESDRDEIGYANDAHVETQSYEETGGKESKPVTSSRIEGVAKSRRTSGEKRQAAVNARRRIANKST